MDWDLGWRGLTLLAAMSLGFGFATGLVAGRGTTRWLWSIVTVAYFAGGLFTSEVWFGWATEKELQPNIDGLSFDEVLLFHVVAAIVAVVITRQVTLRRRLHRPGAAH